MRGAALRVRAPLRRPARVALATAALLAIAIAFAVSTPLAAAVAHAATAPGPTAPTRGPAATWVRPGPPPVESTDGPGSVRPRRAPLRQSPLPSPTAAPEEVRRAADDILARSEFRRPEPNVVERAQNWIEERIARVLQDLTTGSGASFIGWGVLLVALAAIVFLLARFGRTVQVDPRRSVEVSVDRTRTAVEWDAEAERLERAGEWKAALRCRFRALVAALVEHGQVDEIPGRTAGEYRAEVAVALPAASASFDAATMLFEAAWYGDEPTGEVENRRFRELAADVLAESSTHRRSGAMAPVAAEAVPA